MLVFDCKFGIDCKNIESSLCDDCIYIDEENRMSNYIKPDSNVVNPLLADVRELLTMIEQIYPIIQGRAKWNPDEIFTKLVRQVERCRTHFR